MDGSSRSYFYSRKLQADKIRYVKQKTLFVPAAHREVSDERRALHRN